MQVQAQVATEHSVLREDQQGICTLTLNRPDKFNALSAAMIAALTAHLDAIREEPTVRVVVIKANGRAFCVGHDLKEMRQANDPQRIKQLFSDCGGMMQRIEHLPQPVIASVHAVATAAGCQLVAACDLAIASESAKFAVSGINLGLFCSTPAVALSRNLGRKPALEMLLTGDFIDAATAKTYGLVNQVVAAEQLEQAVVAMAAKIAAKPPAAVSMGKQLFYQQLNQPLAEAYQLANQAITCNFYLEDTLEGVDAFLEKRPPNWQL
ncbi:enoyl-CoA hydratase [Thiothrix eikelboomii]|uniref:enoyl-CoA hydratase n=1 Tax=Thiothrix eikelboomii TaxID=92487 RepID=UPI003BB041FC